MRHISQMDVQTWNRFAELFLNRLSAEEVTLLASGRHVHHVLQSMLVELRQPLADDKIVPPDQGQPEPSGLSAPQGMWDQVSGHLHGTDLGVHEIRRLIDNPGLIDVMLRPVHRTLGLVKTRFARLPDRVEQVKGWGIMSLEVEAAALEAEQSGLVARYLGLRHTEEFINLPCVVRRGTVAETVAYALARIEEVHGQEFIAPNLAFLRDPLNRRVRLMGEAECCYAREMDVACRQIDSTLEARLEGIRDRFAAHAARRPFQPEFEAGRVRVEATDLNGYDPDLHRGQTHCTREICSRSVPETLDAFGALFSIAQDRDWISQMRKLYPNRRWGHPGMQGYAYVTPSLAIPGLLLDMPGQERWSHALHLSDTPMFGILSAHDLSTNGGYSFSLRRTMSS